MYIFVELTNNSIKMNTKTLRSFLIALTNPECIRATHARRSNIGNLKFEGGEYVGCEELIDLDKNISSLDSDDYINMYDLLRHADILGSVSAPIMSEDKIKIMSDLIALHDKNPSASQSDFRTLYMTWDNAIKKKKTPVDID